MKYALKNQSQLFYELHGCKRYLKINVLLFGLIKKKQLRLLFNVYDLALFIASSLLACASSSLSSRRASLGALMSWRFSSDKMCSRLQQKTSYARMLVNGTATTFIVLLTPDTSQLWMWRSIRLQRRCSRCYS